MDLFHRSRSAPSARTKVLRLGDGQRYTDQDQALEYIANLRPDTVGAAEMVRLLADIQQTAHEALIESSDALACRRAAHLPFEKGHSASAKPGRARDVNPLR